MPMLQCICLSTKESQPIPQKTVLCLGNFDGVHLGHRALLRRAVEIRQDKHPHAVTAVFCFRAPSTDTLSPTPHLSTLEQKLDLFAECGIEYAILGDFPAMRELTPEEFITNVLQRECRAVATVCGFNYRFGKGGKGTPALLSESIADVSIVSEYKELGDTVSSTRIRRLLLDGNARDAATLLSRPYSIASEIVHGKALGQKMGIPTVNQSIPTPMLVPRHGVYITDCEIDGVCYRGITNVGVHPTVDDNAAVNCETHLLDCNADLYGRVCRVSFLEFLRPEEKFASIDALKEQIARDTEAARNY